MATRQILYKHYQRILHSWPVDNLRPEVSFPPILQRRADAISSPSTKPPQANIVSNDAQAFIPKPKPFDEKGELEQVNVLYSFLENRFAKEYPLSDRMMRPLSQPTYYEDLVKELEEAPKRSWLGAKLNRWKGFFRLS